MRLHVDPRFNHRRIAILTANCCWGNTVKDLLVQLQQICSIQVFFGPERTASHLSGIPPEESVWRSIVFVANFLAKSLVGIVQR